MATRVKDLIYVLCFTRHRRVSLRGYNDDRTGQSFRTMTMRAYDDSTPHDLLMITIIEEMESPTDMVGIETTRTVYVYDSMCKCIWKIDTDKNEVGEWMAELGDEFSLSV